MYICTFWKRTLESFPLGGKWAWRVLLSLLAPAAVNNVLHVEFCWSVKVLFSCRVPGGFISLPAPLRSRMNLTVYEEGCDYELSSFLHICC